MWEQVPTLALRALCWIEFPHFSFFCPSIRIMIEFHLQIQMVQSFVANVVTWFHRFCTARSIGLCTLIQLSVVICMCDVHIHCDIWIEALSSRWDAESRLSVHECTQRMIFEPHTKGYHEILAITREVRHFRLKNVNCFLSTPFSSSLFSCVSTWGFAWFLVVCSARGLKR